MTAPITNDPAEAADVIRRGGLAAFATETVYGLGANALDAAAVSRIFEAKQRPEFDPLIVHVARPEAVDELAVEASQAARALMARFWPGPLTLVLRKRSIVPDIVTAGLETVGIRIPDHAQARELIRLAGCPVAAPSANLFGLVSPTQAAHVADQLGDRVDMILDGGPCRVGVESTVVDLSGAVPILRRPGGTTLEAIESAIGPVQTATTILQGAAAPAPGMLDRHYSTRTPLRLWRPEDPVPMGRIGLLTWCAPAGDTRFAKVVDLSPEGDLACAAAALFGAMRSLDAAGLDVILATRFPETGLGRAINDRLRRAAARG
ncbi:Threonylcarbamoyl-AMP synthase [Caulifigura coniformis]|uniref:Threonylcarbamoyl-AMP synthase n=1 Tax=Caulifigura coniformis TaxID=2527983 RepID=A0A517SKU6_9PLAN|nr:L-threonylcarbamoyladenylate synthase [Caulifigura coniformis]QDT56738.1 Threonylcarbamoyl-AMP synthase [Caulifigura coniformis]